MSLQAFLFQAIGFINETVIPFILAIAFIVFLWNLARYFIIKPDEEREEARRLALWGILGFVVIVSIWGIVNFLVFGLGIDRQNPPCPDYNPNCETRGGGDGGSFAGSGSGGWDPGTTGSNCILGISCEMSGGARVCEVCFVSGN